MSDTGEIRAENRIHKLDVGSTLRETRESMGLSIADIANRIKFAPRQLEALEANDFGQLPQTTFLRGFVRSYARVLHLDETVLIDALPLEPSRQVVAKPQTTDIPFPNLFSARRINVLWLVGALGVALVLALFVLLHEDKAVVNSADIIVEPIALPVSAVVVASAVEGSGAQIVEIAKDLEGSKLAEVEQAEAPSHEQKTKPQVLPIKESITKSPVVIAATAIKLEPRAKSEFKAESDPKTEKQSTSSDTVVAATKPVLPLEILKRRPLHFVFLEGAWAEVIDVNGAILLSKSNSSGSEQWIGGPRRAPYRISVTHPDKVKLYYKGKEIDLSMYVPTETAHLKVE